MTRLLFCVGVGRLTVPGAVREIISRNRSIRDCMRMGIINYSSLATKIQPDVEHLTQRSVNHNTLVVAIKRYADITTDADADSNVRILKNARFSLTDGILDIRITSEETGMAPADILARLSEVTDNYEFFGMSDSMSFLVEDVESVRRAIMKLSGRRSYGSSLARIRISIPQQLSPPDVISHVAEVLHNNGIELRNAFFSGNNTIIMVEEKDASRAYEVLRSDVTRTY